MLSKLVQPFLGILTDVWKSLKGKKRNISLLILVLTPILASHGIPIPDEATLTALFLGGIGLLEHSGILKPLAKVLKELLR